MDIIQGKVYQRLGENGFLERRLVLGIEKGFVFYQVVTGCLDYEYPPERNQISIREWKQWARRSGE
jgi:hypothetical protein